MSRLLALPAALFLAALGAAADEGPIVKLEPFANAHLLLMARGEVNGQVRLADVELWASGDKLRARVAPQSGGAAGDQLWVDGLSSEVLLLRDGKVSEPRRRSLEHGLQLALRAAPELGNSKNDRVAGHPCKVLTEQLPNGMALTRCIWKGLPLSVELSGRGFSFNAAATLVEEDRVALADIQPPPGAPAAAKSLATR